MPLTKPTRNVVLGLDMVGVGEHLFGIAVLYKLAHVEEGGMVAYAASLLHVVRHDYDGVVRLELVRMFPISVLSIWSSLSKCVMALCFYKVTKVGCYGAELMVVKLISQG